MTTTAAMTTTPRTDLPPCPSWCTAPSDPEAHKVCASTPDRDGTWDVVITHPGPKFGRFVTDAEVTVIGGGCYPAVMLPNDRFGPRGFDKPDELRQHATAALAAAAWLEAIWPPEPVEP